ncbi:hypothetical protein FS837_002526 [Tulasnella sp. UAMH 9824]|nr:hypothetical protein FS837_002526 [Tulasnella sp. UAMH 9824]
MSFSFLGLGRRALVTTALGLFVCILIIISQNTKSKWWLLGLLALLPISILAFLVDRYVLRPESPDLAAELPLPVVAVRRTRAPDTAVTTLLRACRSLPIPSAQSLCTIASRYITVFDQTLPRLYLLRPAFDRLVDVRLVTSAKNRASITSVLKRLRDREEVVTTLQRLASSQNYYKTIVLLPLNGSLSVNLKTSSVFHPSPPLVETTLKPGLYQTRPFQRLGYIAGQRHHPSSQHESNLFQSYLRIHFYYVNNKTKDLEPARNPIDTRHSTLSLTSSVRGGVPHASFLGISSLPFPSLPGPAEDHGRTTTNTDSLVSTPGGINALGIVLSDPTGRIVSDARSLGPVKCAVVPISVPFQRSRKLALIGLNIINHAKWSRKSRHDITTAIAPGTATITSPQLADASISSPSPSSVDGKLSSTVSSWPTPTPSTPPTWIDLQLDHQCKAGTPNSPLDSMLEPPNDAQVLDTEATVPEAPEDKIEWTIAWWRQNLPFKGVQGSRRNRNHRRRFGYNASKSPTDEGWKWAKTEGKKPVGERRPMVVTRLAQPITFVHWDAVDDKRGEDEFEKEELQKAILMSMGVLPEDCEADAEASPNSKDFGSRLVETTAPTMTDEDDLDGDGFSNSQQQREKRPVIVVPFYGATTSRALLPLSEQEWALLEEFEATSSS